MLGTLPILTLITVHLYAIAVPRFFKCPLPKIWRKQDGIPMCSERCCMKKSSVLVRCAVCALLLTVSVSLFAHHGTAVSYDIHKVVILKGTVTSFAFANPHSQLYFDV